MRAGFSEESLAGKLFRYRGPSVDYEAIRFQLESALGVPGPGLGSFGLAMYISGMAPVRLLRQATIAAVSAALSS